MALCGPQDAYLQQVASALGVHIAARGQQVVVSGEDDAVHDAKVVLEDLYDLVAKGRVLDDQQVEAALRVHNGLLSAEDVRPRDVLADLVVSTPRKNVAPRSVMQRDYLEALLTHDLTFGLGPAGTGKTYLATAVAVAGIKEKQFKKLVLTRPVVEAGERLGFLPGTLEEKIDPYLRPFFDALEDMLGKDTLEKWKAQGVVEVAPLAYMRGRTLEQCCMVLDEAQNTTPGQMRLFLTRMGQGSKMIVTGDLSQTDLPKGQPNGLAEAVKLLGHISGVTSITFQPEDVVRHPLVARIVNALDAEDRQGEILQGQSVKSKL